MKTRLKAISLFSNVGVAETYLENIGIDVLVANEIDEKRGAFYQHLYPKTKMIVGDITNDTTQSIILHEAQKQKIDMVIATPPCQGMSIAGKRDPLDIRNQLIYYAVEIIKKINPRYVFLENVPQTLTTKITVNGKLMLIPDYLKNELGNDYFFASQSLVSAQDYGVPQMRKRNIFLLTRKDQKIRWEMPTPQKRITLKDAIGDLPQVDPILKEGIEETIKLFPDFKKKKEEALKISRFHYPPKHAKKHVIAMMHTPSGCTAFDNLIYYPKKNNGERVNGHFNTYRRLAWNKPSRTMTQNCGVISSLCCVHPGRKYVSKTGEILYSDPRCFTLLELFIVTSLPRDWNVPEWADEKMIRKVIGEGIPPMLVKNIMLNLINYL
ncbi:MAG: DNA cytosine methyltransferase [Bacilli bacterium]|nr:DNA cytosine methyltransferase [Bacilli bacterium]